MSCLPCTLVLSVGFHGAVCMPCRSACLPAACLARSFWVKGSMGLCACHACLSVCLSVCLSSKFALGVGSMGPSRLLCPASPWSPPTPLNLKGHHLGQASLDAEACFR
jgi:hypothetical protein